MGLLAKIFLPLMAGFAGGVYVDRTYPKQVPNVDDMAKCFKKEAQELQEIVENMKKK